MKQSLVGLTVKNLPFPFHNKIYPISIILIFLCHGSDLHATNWFLHFHNLSALLVKSALFFLGRQSSLHCSFLLQLHFPSLLLFTLHSLFLIVCATFVQQTWHSASVSMQFLSGKILRVSRIQPTLETKWTSVATSEFLNWSTLTKTFFRVNPSGVCVKDNPN